MSKIKTHHQHKAAFKDLFMFKENLTKKHSSGWTVYSTDHSELQLEKGDFQVVALCSAQIKTVDKVLVLQQSSFMVQRRRKEKLSRPNWSGKEDGWKRILADDRCAGHFKTVKKFLSVQISGDHMCWEGPRGHSLRAFWGPLASPRPTSWLDISLVLDLGVRWLRRSMGGTSLPHQLPQELEPGQE